MTPPDVQPRLEPRREFYSWAILFFVAAERHNVMPDYLNLIRETHADHFHVFRNYYSNVFWRS